MPLTLPRLRRYALARSLFAPTTLGRAVARLGFVQADPLRAPARAQDLTLRHRVSGYVVGDLERAYRRLGLEEDFFVNYGYLRRQHQALMHPRPPSTSWSRAKRAKAEAVLALVRARGVVHPREVDATLAHGKVRNWFGGSSNLTTQLLEGLHYRGLVRVAGRKGGTRLYAPRPEWPAHGDDARCRANMDTLVDVIVTAYAPLPASTLAQLVNRLRWAAPQWADDRKRALAHAKQRLGHARIDGIEWFWPAHEDPGSRSHRVEDRVRLLAPFDPVVWDRGRFETFFGWPYRFEAYTPAPKRKLGHYALPLLWREDVIGWANLSVRDGQLVPELGFVAKRPHERAFAAALDAELDDMARFVGLR